MSIILHGIDRLEKIAFSLRCRNNFFCASVNNPRLTKIFPSTSHVRNFILHYFHGMRLVVCKDYFLIGSLKEPRALSLWQSTYVEL